MANEQNAARIYKICTRSEWNEAQRTQRYAGSSDDRRDGYIHFSTRAQLAGTAAKHFRGKNDLVLVTVDAAALGEALKWEPSREGKLFPHLFAALDARAAIAVRELQCGADGVPIIPEDA